MAKLDFPDNPTSGDLYIAPNGVTYTYDDTSLPFGVWLAKATSPLEISSPGIISGTATVGSTLAYATGTATGGQLPYTYSWEWRRVSDNAVLQNNGSTYVISAALDGDQVYVALTVTDDIGGSVSGNTTAYPTGSTITFSSFPNTTFSPGSGPNASPGSVNTGSLRGTATATWQDGFDTIYTTGSLLFQVNGGGYSSSSKSVADGDTVDIIWDTAAVASAADGATLTGIFTNGTYENTYSLTVDRAPVNFAFNNLSDQGISTQVTSNTVTPTGFNVPVSASFAGTATPLTLVGLSVGGGSFGSSPQTVTPGQSLQLRGTTGSSNSTTYGVSVSLGSGPAVTDTWNVSTSSVAASIAEPSIISPADGATDVNPALNSPSSISLVGSTYTPLNGAGSQTSSQWEVYEGGFPLTSANVITGVSTPSTWSSPINIGVGSSGQTSQVTVINEVAYLTIVGAAAVKKTIDASAWASVTNPFTSASAMTKTITSLGGTTLLAWGSGATNGVDKLRYAISTDNGASWTEVDIGGISNRGYPVCAVSDGTPNAIIGVTQNADTGGSGTGNLVVRSINGGANWQNWTSIGSNTATPTTAAYSNGKFVVAGTNGLCVFSENEGGSWPTSATAFAGDLEVYAGNGQFVMLESGSGAVYTSTDGSNWTYRSNLAVSNVGLLNSRLSYFDGMYYVARGNGSNTYYYSPDLLNWGSSNTNLSGDGVIALVKTSSTFVAVGPSKSSKAASANSTTTLTISGALSEGFDVGDLVVSSPAGGGPSVVTALTNSQVTVTNAGTWLDNSTQSLTRDSSTYTAVAGSPFTVSSAPYTSLDIAQSAFDVSSTYYARVQYATTNASAATSEWSAWSEFSTAANFVPDIGAEYGGGYFAGQINDGSTIYNLVVAPVTSGALEGQYGGAAPATIQYRNPAQADLPAATSENEVYGAGATTTFADAAHPMFNWCVNGGTGPNAGNYDATNVAGTGIGGYNDWYIPAKNELAVLYFFLKPDTTANNTGFGSNPNSVAPYTPNTNYAAGFPNQTTSTLFQAGGAQAFSTAVYYWSATGVSSGTGSAWEQVFASGLQNGFSKALNAYARAIRRVPA